MAKLPPSISAYRKVDGSTSYRVWAYDPAKKAKAYVGTYNSVAEAKDAKRGFERTATGLAGQEANMSVAAWAALWLRGRNDLKTQTKEGYALQLANFVAEFGDLPMNSNSRFEAAC